MSQDRYAEIIFPDGRTTLVPMGRGFSKAEKQRARIAVYEAVLAGELTRPHICPRCKRKSKFPIEAHHPDYSKPLDVEWLCRSCHIKEGLQAIKPKKNVIDQEVL